MYITIAITLHLYLYYRITLIIALYVNKISAGTLLLAIQQAEAVTASRVASNIIIEFVNKLSCDVIEMKRH